MIFFATIYNILDSIIQKIAEQCSQANPRINELAVCELRPYIESFLDSNWLNSKLAEYEQWALNNSDPFLQRNLLHRPINSNFIVAAIWAARSWEKEYQKDKCFRPPMGPKRLLNIACSLAVLELHAGVLMDNDAREHIRQRLQAHDQLWGLIHECNTFAYFIQKSVDVEPSFLKKASQQEILLRSKGQTEQVQCKCKPPGAGRAISQENFTTLAGCIARDIRLSKQKLIIRIGSTGQIESQDIEFLRNQFRGGIDIYNSPLLVRNNQRTFSIQTEPLIGEITVDQARSYLENYDLHLIMGIAEPVENSEKYETVVVVGIDAKPNEKPWNSLERSIRDGVRQLQQGQLGIVAIHYVDHIGNFEQLRPEDMPMGFKMGELIRTTPQLGAVILSSEPDLQLPGAGGPGQSKWYYKKEWPFISDIPFG